MKREEDNVINISPNEPELNPKFVEEVLKNEKHNNCTAINDLDELFD